MQNHIATITIPNTQTATTSAAAITSVTALPPYYRPFADQNFLIRVNSNGTQQTGLAIVATTGIITINATPAGGTFPIGAGASGPFMTAITYVV